MKLIADKFKIINQEDGPWFALKIKELAMARSFIMKHKGDKQTIEIKKHYEKRSIDANRYFWKLVDEMAKHTGINKTEIYRQSLREIGGVCDHLCIQASAVDRFCNNWSSKGLGWQTEREESKIPGCVNVVAYYGSSTFDTHQMFRLIDNIVQDCKSVGIETMTPNEISRLKEEWENASANKTHGNKPES